MFCGTKFESMNKTIQMNQLKLLVIIVFVFALSSSGSISFAPASEKPSPKNHEVSKNVILYQMHVKIIDAKIELFFSCSRVKNHALRTWL